MNIYSVQLCFVSIDYVSNFTFSFLLPISHAPILMYSSSFFFSSFLLLRLICAAREKKLYLSIELIGGIQHLLTIFVHLQLVH